MIIKFILFESAKDTAILRWSRLRFGDETLARNVQNTFYLRRLETSVTPANVEAVGKPIEHDRRVRIDEIRSKVKYWSWERGFHYSESWRSAKSRAPKEAAAGQCFNRNEEVEQFACDCFLTQLSTFCETAMKNLAIWRQKCIETNGAYT